MSAAMSFEQRLVRLEQIANELQGDGLELSRALQLFEEGVENLRAAAKELARAEARVERLIERVDGTFDVGEASE